MTSRARIFYSPIIAVSLAGCGDLGKIEKKVDAYGGQALQAVDEAIREIGRANTTMEQVGSTLDETKKDLDEGIYRDQIEELIGRTAGAADVTTKSSVDFLRARVVEDLQNIRRTILGGKPVARVPVLSMAESPEINFASESRNTVSVVGWNLDVAQQNPKKFKLIIKNLNKKDRVVNRNHISFQGQYKITLNTSNNGIPLKHHDYKLVFVGFEPAFELSVIGSSPPPVPKQPKRDPKFGDSRAVGGKGGEPFRDRERKTPRVTKIAIRAAARVDSVQLVIDGKDGPQRGSNGGTLSEVTLSRDEYISAISGRAGSRIDAIRIHIKNRQNPAKSRETDLFGSRTGGAPYRLEAPDGYEVIGFHGRASAELDAVGIIYREIL